MLCFRLVSVWLELTDLLGVTCGGAMGSISHNIVVRRRAGSITHLVVGGFVLCVLGGIGFWLGAGRRDVAAEREVFPLVVRDGDADFGEAFMQREFRWQLPIRNISARPVPVVEFKSSCHCTAITPHEFIIPAGGAASVEVVLDTTGNWKGGDVERAHDFSVDLLPVIGGQKRAMGRWVIKGRVRRPLAFSPPVVLYGETLLEGERLPEKTMLVRTPAGVERLAVDCDWPSVRFEAAPSQTLGTGEFEIAVLPGAQTPPSGRFEIDAQVTGFLPAGDCLPPVPLRLAGLVVSEFYAIPHTVRLTASSQGQAVTADVVVQSRREGEFEVEQVLTSGSDLVVEPQHAGRGRTHTFRVALGERSSNAGEKRLSFVVRSRSGDRKHVDVNVVAIR